ncbi:hypothetical protein PIB30_024737 [Stylosanthes scabra]|uniref:Uncharacterized protein n=1 Tax=Stylosanthes scabra TaxID=79078 RepID=A0ABU6SBB0_9FABA|nr:hypothetical protein [Stylosanthes scabra]
MLQPCQQVCHHPIHQLPWPLINHTPVPHFRPRRHPPDKLGFLHHDPFTIDTAKRSPSSPTPTSSACHANIDTFTVFRSLTPLLIALVGYVSTDSAFILTAYSWAFCLCCHYHHIDGLHRAHGYESRVEYLGFCFVQQFIVSNDCALLLVAYGWLWKGEKGRR